MPRWKSIEKYGFEPGSILCTECGWKPEDPWDTHPDGFVDVDGYVYCEECAKRVREGFFEIDKPSKPDR